MALGLHLQVPSTKQLKCILQLQLPLPPKTLHELLDPALKLHSELLRRDQPQRPQLGL